MKQLALLVAIMTFALSCAAQTINGFTLTATESRGGTISKSPDQTSYGDGTRVQLTAVANDGYVFDGWTGDVSTLQNPLTLTMNGSRMLRANFIRAGVGVIIDDTDENVEFTGSKGDKSWVPSSQTYTGMRYESHQFTPAVNGKATAWATFRPNIPKAGTYDVYVWYLNGENRSIATSWKIAHKSGSMDITVNQQINGATWFRIGSDIEFDAGNKGTVTVANNTPDANSGKVVVADAVAFVYVGAP